MMFPFICLNDLNTWLFTPALSPALLPSSLLLFQGSIAAGFVAPRLPSHPLSPLLEKSFLLHLFTSPHAQTALYSPIAVPRVAHCSLPEHRPHGHVHQTL